MTRLLVLLLALIPCAADAIVIRHDVSDANYRIAGSAFPALVDLPGEGQGVLVAPRWVVTAAHAVSWQMEVTEVAIDGAPRTVKRLILYPGYQKLPQRLINESLASGDGSAVTKFLADSNDIALIELAAPVTDVVPATIYMGDIKVGTVVELLGKGATGNGLTGQNPNSSHRTELRHAFTRATAVSDRWVCYTFARPPTALPLEGITGDGDSGGPGLIDADGRRQVATLTSWKLVEGDTRKFRAGLYGAVTYNLRISHYIDWIDGIISGETPSK